jgi:hypothetical protein
MKFDFNQLSTRRISLENFGLNWRFTDGKYDLLSEECLKKLLPLSADASKILFDYLSVVLHKDFPFTKDCFSDDDIKYTNAENHVQIQQWLLSQTNTNPEQKVYVSWNNNEAMIVPWELFIKHLDIFYYSGTDDLTVVDETMKWALLLHHSDTIYLAKKTG